MASEQTKYVDKLVRKMSEGMSTEEWVKMASSGLQDQQSEALQFFTLLQVQATNRNADALERIASAQEKSAVVKMEKLEL